MIGRAALGIWMDVDRAGLDDFDAWYRRQHLPERLAVPGFLRGRRYRSTGEGPVYFTLYETADAAVLSSAPYMERLNAPTEWTRRALPLIRRMVRNAYRLVAASADDLTAATVLTVRIQPHSGRGPYVRSWLAGDAASALAPVAAGWGLYESDTSGTSVMTEERRIVGGDVIAAPPFLALCGASPATEPVLREHWHTWARTIAADVTLDTYQLLYALSWTGPEI